MRRTLTASFGASVAIQATNVVTGILLARALGPEGRGELAVVLLWPGLLALVGGFGVVHGATFHAAQGVWSAGTLAGTSIAIALVQSSVLIAVGALLLPTVLAGHDPDVVRAALVFLGFIPVHLVALYLTFVLNGLHRFTAFQLLRVGIVGLTAVALVGFALGDRLTLLSATFAYLAATATICAAAVVVVRRGGGGAFSCNSRLARDLLSYGLRSHPSNMAGTLNERLDQLLISVILAPVSLGLYVVAVTLSSATMLVGSSVSLIALPAVARLEGDERIRAVRRLVGLTIAGATAVTVPILALAPDLIGLLFGDAFRSAAAVSRLLLLGAILLASSRVLGSVLMALDRPLDASAAEGAALVVTVVGLALFLPTFGLVGAGVASVLAYGAGAGWMVRRVSRTLAISPAQLLLPRWSDVTSRARAARASAVCLARSVSR